MWARIALSLVFFASAVYPQQMTQTCYFLVGPLKGSTHTFNGYSPIPIGSSCHDGAGSLGVAVKIGNSPIGRFAMKGGTAACSDVIGTPVPYQPNPNIAKSGLSTISGNRPVIFLKPGDLAGYTAPVQRFLLAHECGHHALGHVLAVLYYHVFIGPEDELAADCFAGDELKRLGLLSPTERNEVFAFLSTVPRDPTTFAGPLRVSKLRQCMH